MIKPGTIIRVAVHNYTWGKYNPSKGDFLYVSSYNAGHLQGYCYYGCNTTGNLYTVVLYESQLEIVSEDLIELYDSNKAEFLKKFDEIQLLYRL